MKIALAAFLVLAIVSESGCSEVKNVRCLGVYRHQTMTNNAKQNNEIGEKASLGFDIERPGWVTNIISSIYRKQRKRIVTVKYDSNPYAESSTSGFGFLKINTESDVSMIANAEGNDKGEPSKILLYDPINGYVKYEEEQGDSTRSFSGVCQKEID